MTRRNGGSSAAGRGRVWRSVVTGAAVAVIALGGGVANADEPVADTAVPPVPSSAPLVDSGEPVVAVGLPPVPPTTVVVAVGLPPVPPTTVAANTATDADGGSVAGAVAGAVAAAAVAEWRA